METADMKTSHPFLQGGGEMGEFIRKFDWSGTSIGTPHTWPYSLRTTVSNLLRSKFPMFLWWGEELIQFYNDAYRPSLGNGGKHPMALGQRGSECWTEVWPVIFPLIEQVRNTGEAIWMADQLIPIDRNGTIEDAYWTFSYSLVLNDDGNFGGVLATCIETTEAVEGRRRRSAESVSRFRSAIEQAPVAIALTRGEEMIFESINEPMLQVINRQNKMDVLGRKLLDVLPQLRNQPVCEILQKVLKTGEPFTGIEVPATLIDEANSNPRFFNINYSRIADAEGTDYVLHMSADVTEQVLARRKIEESEARFRSLIEEAPVATALFRGREMIIEVANVPMLEIWGKGDSVFGKPLSVALPELEGQPFLPILDDVFTTGNAYSDSAARADLFVDGELRTYYFDFTYKPLRNADGEVFAIIDMAIDVTEQVIARQKLIEKEGALEAALEQVRLSKEAAELGTFDMDPQTGTMHWDRRCRDLFGISHDGPVEFARDFLKRLHPDDRQRVEEVVLAIFNPSLRNGDYDVEYRTIGADDGVERWVRAKGKVYFDNDDKPVRFIGSVLDITPQVGARQQIESLVSQRTKELAQANDTLLALNKELQRSNAHLEEFAHAASHDLKEPVRKIQVFTGQLKAQLRSHLDENGSRTFSRIESATQRMGNLIDDLLLYSHVSQRPREKEAVDLNQKVKHVLEDLELDIEEKKASIHVSQLPVVQGYKRQLQQLFQNLLSNALKYSKADELPKIEITSSVKTEGSNSYYVVVVQDNGIGFDQEYEHQIFQMFSRLHGRSEYSGTGVGLAIVKKVVENHNGLIRTKSEPNKGSRFEIFLPT